MAGSERTSDLEVFRDTLAHRRPDRIPYHFSCTPDLDRRLREHVGGNGDYFTHYGCFGHQHMGPVRPAGAAPPDYSPYWNKEEMPPGAWINHLGVMEVPSGLYHFTGYVSPLRHAQSFDEIERYPIEDVSKFDFGHFPGTVQAAHARGRPAALGIGHMYEDAWQMRGYEEFLADMVERPAWAESILERIFQNNLYAAVQAAKAGADVIHCGDDVANQRNMMFSPAMWRHFIHSRWRKVWGAVKETSPATAIHYHSDGNVMAIVGELVEAGLDILNPVQPECLDADEIHQRWGAKLSFDGLMGTQSTMPFATPAQVRARVKECIDKYGRNGGLILAPTHVLEPEVPIANIEAFVGACREFGRFS